MPSNQTRVFIKSFHKNLNLISYHLLQNWRSSFYSPTTSKAFRPFTRSHPMRSSLDCLLICLFIFPVHFSCSFFLFICPVQLKLLSSNAPGNRMKNKMENRFCTPDRSPLLDGQTVSVLVLLRALQLPELPLMFPVKYLPRIFRESSFHF